MKHARLISYFGLVIACSMSWLALLFYFLVLDQEYQTINPDTITLRKYVPESVEPQKDYQPNSWSVRTRTEAYLSQNTSKQYLQYSLETYKNLALNVSEIEVRRRLLPRLKIFMYDVGEELIGYDYLKNNFRVQGKQNTTMYEWCRKTYWGPELYVYEHLKSAPQRTKKKSEAHLFYIPMVS